jgi:RNA polymerase sigma-70 factor (ECF subfamily)
VGSVSCVDDTFLVSQARSGNHGAFEELVRQHDRLILRLALRLTGSEHDAHDIYQEALLKAYRNLAGFRLECCFSTWLYRIVTNLCFEHLRRQRSKKESMRVAVNAEGEEFNSLDGIPDARAMDPEKTLMGQEVGARIGRALSRLTPRERAVFELRHYHGLKLRTIGTILNGSEQTAKNTLFRATHKMRGMLSDLR